MNFILQRQPDTDEGTFGTLASEDGKFSLRTIELPWRNNDNGHSCIEVGVYKATLFKSPSKGMVYLLRDVPNRTMIEIHRANWAGDVTKGWVSELLGCIALGTGVARLQNKEGKLQAGVTNSGIAFPRFMAYTHGAPITLTIKGPQNA